MTDEDRDLHRAFGGLRERDRSELPEFDAIFARARAAAPPAPPQRWRLALVGTAAVAAAAIGVALLRPFGSDRDAPFRDLENIGAWAMPSDVLLEVPGRELLHELPRWEPAIEPEARALPSTSGSFRRSMG